jgi:hypothetical protein
VIDLLSKKSELRPRIIMHAMNAVLEAADTLIEQKKLQRIERKFSEDVLRDYIIVPEAEESEDD